MKYCLQHQCHYDFDESAITIAAAAAQVAGVSHQQQRYIDKDMICRSRIYEEYGKDQEPAVPFICHLAC